MPAPRILVVEDESIVALHIRQELLQLGYDVPAAVATGAQALHEIETSRPDLVLMDINLKGELDGIATAAEIPSAYQVPVIYLTAYSEQATLERASATNPYGYLLKPFSERELHAMIQTTLARCRAERASLAARERQVQAEKMAALTQFAGGVADEFNDLLTVFYSQLEVLGHHAIGHPAIADPIEDAFKEVIDKEKLIQRLRVFGGRQTLVPGLVCVGDFVTDLSKRLRPMLDEPISLVTHLPEELWRVRADVSKLTEAVLALAMNARDAMPDGGTLTIEGHNIVLDQAPEVTSGRFVLITVADSGAGMPRPVIDRAFEPFFSTKTDHDGLGLSLVFGFVRQSGGHIGIDSETGRGTVARIYIPAASGECDTNVATTGEAVDPFVRSVSADVTGDAEAFPRRVPSDASSRRHTRSAAFPTEDALPLTWRKTENALFAAIRSSHGDIRYRLIVEALPHRNGWDWAVWRPGDGGETSRHGRASSVPIAMAAAEAAARLLAEWDSRFD